MNASRCLLLLAAGAIPLAAACRTDPDPTRAPGELQLRGARYDAARAEPGDGVAPLARWVLPRHLNEVSGLALTPDGRLLAHDDEHGRVTVIDPRRGVVLSEFGLAGRNAGGDFEGITLVDSTIVMVTSRGRLVSFREGANGSSVPFTEFDTHLGRRCEVEGIAFDPGTSELLLPCKRGGRDDAVVIHRLGIPLVHGMRATVQAIPLGRLRASHLGKAFHPTDITRDPVTGNFVLVAAPERALIELSPAGAVVRRIVLPARHVQAEGIAMTPDGTLIVSDEARSGAAAITVYRWPPGGLTLQ